MKLLCSTGVFPLVLDIKDQNKCLVILLVAIFILHNFVEFCYLHCVFYVVTCWDCSLFLGYQQSWWSSWYKILPCRTTEAAARGKNSEVWLRVLLNKQKEEQKGLMKIGGVIESIFVWIVIGRLQTNWHVLI